MSDVEEYLRDQLERANDALENSRDEVARLRMVLRTLAECPPGTKEQKAKRQMTMAKRRSPQDPNTKEGDGR